MTTNMTTADHLTFTKLFAERCGVTYAKVLHLSISTKELVEAFNRHSKASLKLDESTGQVMVTDQSQGDLKQQIDRFATFVWKDVFLGQIQPKRAAQTSRGA